MEMIARSIRVRGRVQGVGFRAWVEAVARRQELGGWVRNRRDGSVEALLAGPAPAVEAMIDALRRGPPGARVDAVEVAPSDGQPPRAFEIRPTE
jgi:acylphosphatase